jgi:ribosome-associated protein
MGAAVRPMAGRNDRKPHEEYKEVPEIRPLQLARTCKEFALDKKGEDILILDLRGLSSVTDYFVICHGTSRRHVQTIAEHIRLSMKKRDLPEAHMEGFPEGRWVVLDYIEAIVHVFDRETRKIYQLEELWGDAARVE